jgi:hypothetical protein
MDPSLVAIIMASVLAGERIFQLIMNRVKNSECSQCCKVEMRSTDSIKRINENKEVTMQSIDSML